MIYRARGRLLSGEDGQALVLATLMMLVVLGMAAFSIDVAHWYQRHHRDQVAADAAALAAANCLANSSTTNTSPNGCGSMNDPNAVSVATSIAAANGSTISTSNVSLGFDSVTVTTPSKVPAWFARIDNVQAAYASATARVRYHPSGTAFTCPTGGLNTCISFFAANTTCPSSATNMTTGLVLVTNDSGGGNTVIPNAYTNGYFFDGANSASSTVDVGLPGTSGTPNCATANTSVKGATETYTSGPVPYPAAWRMPSINDCTKTAPYFSTQSGTPSQDQITTPGIYCATTNGQIASTASPSCPSTPTVGETGYIYVDESSPALTPGGWYEFVTPCTVINNSSTPTITNVPGQPIVYGTANITTPATATSLPTCTSAANAGTAGSDLYVNGSNANITAPLYDQCGTVDINQNNAYLGYVEAWNIILEKNNTITGNGPTSASGGGVTPLPANDFLSG